MKEKYGFRATTAGRCQPFCKFPESKEIRLHTTPSPFNNHRDVVRRAQPSNHCLCCWDDGRLPLVVPYSRVFRSWRMDEQQIHETWTEASGAVATRCTHPRIRNHVTGCSGMGRQSFALRSKIRRSGAFQYCELEPVFFK
jgi:hypothetical protein